MRTLQDMRDVYTPGVARVCLAIADDPALAHRFTMIGRTVAICTNGTRVLGLGDIGPVASMPVMEGKAMFYRQLAGISAMPILIDADDPDTFVETVKRIAGGFGGIHLEDIRAPDCFEIEARLIAELDIPVMHDDVHGTAVATLGAVLVACAHAGIELSESVVGQIGLGAAGFGIANLIREAGAKAVLASDPSEASHERARERRHRGRLVRGGDGARPDRHRHHGPARPHHARDGPRRARSSSPSPTPTPRSPRRTPKPPAPPSPPTARWSTTSSASPASSAAPSPPAREVISTGMKLAAARAIAGLTAEVRARPRRPRPRRPRRGRPRRRRGGARRGPRPTPSESRPASSRASDPVLGV